MSVVEDIGNDGVLTNNHGSFMDFNADNDDDDDDEITYYDISRKE